MAKMARMAKPETEPADEVLVVAAILGNLDAFDELVSRYRAAAVRVAQGIVGRENAEDVAQDAMLLAFKALPSIDEPAKFAAWLSAITRHRALRFGKRERLHQTGRVEFDEFLLQEVETLARPLARESNEELAWALDRIPAEYALVLRMRFLDEMPLKRIAAFLGLSLATVKWRVYQGKKLLKEEVRSLESGGGGQETGMKR